MTQVTRPRSLTGTFLTKRRHHQTALVISVLVCNLVLSWGQTAAAPETRPTTSLADSLKRVDTENTQLHIFYVHGMAADGPGASASVNLRQSICKFLRDCTTRGGEFEGTDYADSHRFALDAPPPALTYLGQQVWRTDASGSSEEWNASAPYVDHYKIVRKVAPEPSTSTRSIGGRSFSPRNAAKSSRRTQPPLVPTEPTSTNAVCTPQKTPTRKRITEGFGRIRS